LQHCYIVIAWCSSYKHHPSCTHAHVPYCPFCALYNFLVQNARTHTLTHTHFKTQATTDFLDTLLTLLAIWPAIHASNVRRQRASLQAWGHNGVRVCTCVCVCDVRECLCVSACLTTCKQRASAACLPASMGPQWGACVCKCVCVCQHVYVCVSACLTTSTGLFSGVLLA